MAKRTKTNRSKKTTSSRYCSCFMCTGTLLNERYFKEKKRRKKEVIDYIKNIDKEENNDMNDEVYYLDTLSNYIMIKNKL